jgi:hypothetical protein
MLSLFPIPPALLEVEEVCTALRTAGALPLKAIRMVMHHMPSTAVPLMPSQARPRIPKKRAHRLTWGRCDGKQPFRSDGSDHGTTSQRYGQEPEALHNHTARHQV